MLRFYETPALLKAGRDKFGERFIRLRQAKNSYTRSPATAGSPHSSDPGNRDPPEADKSTLRSDKLVAGNPNLTLKF